MNAPRLAPLLFFLSCFRDCGIVVEPMLWEHETRVRFSAVPFRLMSYLLFWPTQYIFPFVAPLIIEIWSNFIDKVGSHFTHKSRLR